MNTFMLYTASFGSSIRTMISWSTRRISSDMVTMRLPTGLLIEYFLRFVRQTSLLFLRTDYMLILDRKGIFYWILLLFFFSIWIVLKPRAVCYCCQCHFRFQESSLVRSKERWGMRTSSTSYCLRKTSLLSLVLNIGMFHSYSDSRMLVNFLLIEEVSCWWHNELYITILNVCVFALICFTYWIAYLQILYWYYGFTYKNLIMSEEA